MTQQASSSTAKDRRTWTGAAAYAAMLIGALALFIQIDHVGAGLAAAGTPSLVATSTSTTGKPNILIHVLATLAAVVVTGQALGRLCRIVGQPPVIGEIVAGILLGPSFLGRLWPEAGRMVCRQG